MKPIPSGSPGKLRAVLLGGMMLGALMSASAQPAASTYFFTHLAGSLGGPGRADGTGPAARFDSPDGVAIDNAGNLYVVDSANHTIRKIAPGGAVTTFAGAAGVTGSADGAGADARFFDPHGVALDNAGNLYVADSGNATIRQITAAGVVTTVAGRAGAQGSTDGTGGAALFWYPRAVAVDRAGAVYVADNSTIRKITAGGVVTTPAGQPGPWGEADGTGPAAQFSHPSGIAVDAAGTVYVADSGNNKIRLITPAGVVTTLRDPTGAIARVASPHGITVDNAGNLYVAARFGYSINKITPTGVVTILAGMAGVFGSADGTGAAAQFHFPAGLALDGAGNSFVADSYNHTVRKITPAGLTTTVAGLANVPGSADGTGPDARFHYPAALGVDNAGNVYVEDSVHSTIRKVTPGGVVSTFFGPPQPFPSPDGPGPAAQFYFPYPVAVDNTGNVFRLDIHRIFKITPAGAVTTFAGIIGQGGSTDGTGTAARFAGPRGAAADSAGNLFVADTGNGTIRKITPAGVVTTLAGTAGVFGSADGTGAAASFRYVHSIAVDLAGNVYVKDDCTIRRVTPAGVVTTLAGLTGVSASVDGTGVDARFPLDYNVAGGLAADNTGNVFVVDFYSHTIRRVTPNGVVTTVAGKSGFLGSDDGIAAEARFNSPAGVAVDAAGNLYIADAGNNAIRKGQPAGPPVISTQPASQSVATGANVQFTVTAAGVPAPAYQWYLNGNPFNGATGSKLSLANAAATDAGDYTVVVSNAVGSVTSNKATLSIAAAPPVTPPASPASGGGGGAIGGPYFLGLLALVGVRILAWRRGAGRKARRLLLAGLGSLAAVAALAQPAAANYFFSHLAGSAGGPGSNDGAGAAAHFNFPYGVAVDRTGNLFVADAGSHIIRKITPAGMVSTWAGAAGVAGSADGTGAAARFDYPYGLAVDGAGNVYVADSNNHTLRRITPGGAVTTLAGTAGAAGSADGSGAAARFASPRGVAVDSAGTVYVTDYADHTIRKITAGGVVTTLAGTAGVPGFYWSGDGSGAAARFDGPSGVAVDGAGNLFVADSGSKTIRRVTPDGTVTTLAGVPTTGTSDSVDGTGGIARFTDPAGVAVDNAGNVYITDGLSPSIRKITPSGGVTTLAGTYRGFGHADGTGATAQFSYPSGVAVDASGMLFVTDVGSSLAEGGNYFIDQTGGGTIRQVTPGGVVTTFAGAPVTLGTADGTGSAAQFYFPFGVAVDNAGNVYVADEGNSTIRRIAPDGAVTTLAGRARQPGNADGTGAEARFRHPHGMAVDSAGNLYVSDLVTSHFYGSNGGVIRKIAPGGVVTTVAGTDSFGNPYGVAVDAMGNLYVADAGTPNIDRLGRYVDGPAGNTIYKITPGGAVTTLAGTAAHGSADGIGTAARFFTPKGLAVDGAGNVYVADQYNHTIRKITPAGEVTTLAGSAGQPGSTDGGGAAARFNSPEGLAVDGTGNVYVAEQYSHTLRRVTPEGAVTTVGGTTRSAGSADGIGVAAGFNRPTGIAVDGAGILYVAEYFNHAIRRGQPAGPPVITTQPAHQSVALGANVQFTVAAAGVPAPAYQWYLNGRPFNGATGSTLSFANAAATDAGDYTVVVSNPMGTVTSNKATLSVAAAPVASASPASAGGGGGAIDGRLVLALLVLGAARAIARPPRSRSPGRILPLE